MISQFFRSRAAASLPVPAVPPGERVYAIGDVHGRRDLLENLLEQIAADHAMRGSATQHLIFLGDLIDRGPESAAVLELICQLQQRWPGTRCLMGNHEEVFQLALGGDREALRLFVRIGGRETILSYGITPDAYEAADYAELLSMLVAQVPARHVALLDGMENMILIGDYAFVHAGIRPGIPLDAQKTGDLRWIRSQFLNHGAPLEKMVVHGHTISVEVEQRSHRIGLDTGAFATGRLTAMGFEGTERWVLQT